jgi:hypothetical protein
MKMNMAVKMDANLEGQTDTENSGLAHKYLKGGQGRITYFVNCIVKSLIHNALGMLSWEKLGCSEYEWDNCRHCLLESITKVEKIRVRLSEALDVTLNHQKCFSVT